MKISNFSTTEGLNVLCEIAPYVINITSDEGLLNELRSAISPGKAVTYAEWVTLGAQKITKLIPIIFKNRRNDILNIVSVVNNKTLAEIEEQNILVTAKQIRDIAQDKDMIDFFVSCTVSEVIE